jgi:signal transduction histidine kinase
VLADKADLTGQLNGFLDRPTSPQLQEVEHAYNRWHEAQVARANEYRIVLAGYAATLLLVLGWLGLRLRRSYGDLDAANASLSRANLTLEDTVEERTRDLTKAMKDLRESETQLVQSEKMASLGQMVAGVAHEINTPLGYARSNASIVRTSLGDIRDLCSAQTRALKLLTTQASDEEVAEALAEAQQRAETVKPEELSGDLDNLLADADHGLSQIAELVGSLKDFSRVDRSRTDLIGINDCIDAALKIAANQLKHRVEVVKSYAALPKIECSPSQLNQVFLNLFTNSAQAIPEKGKIFVHTSSEKDGIAVRVLDTGVGMTEEVKARIFEPFFTTKPIGKGTGLGLSIVFRIIEDHGGRIEVRSTPGKGSEFKLYLPLKQRRTEAAPAAAQAA